MLEGPLDLRSSSGMPCLGDRCGSSSPGSQSQICRVCFLSVLGVGSSRAERKDDGKEGLVKLGVYSSRHCTSSSPNTMPASDSDKVIGRHLLALYGLVGGGHQQAPQLAACPAGAGLMDTPGGGVKTSP